MADITAVTLYLTHTHIRGDFIPEGEPSTIKLMEPCVTFWVITTPEDAEADLRSRFPVETHDPDYEIVHEERPGQHVCRGVVPR